MSGYRDRSNYDPYAGNAYGPPKRPYNWVQWTGVAFAVAGIAFELAYFAAKLGWIRPFADSPTIGSSIVLISIPLINSRRETVTDEVAALRHRRALIAVAVALVTFAVVMAAIIYSKGA